MSEQIKQVVLDINVVQALVQYLAKKPYQESAQLIEAIRQAEPLVVEDKKDEESE